MNIEIYVWFKEYFCDGHIYKMYGNVSNLVLGI